MRISDWSSDVCSSDLQHLVVALDTARVLADEEILVAGKAEHEVAGANADAPLVVGHAHHGDVEVPARPAVPACDEGRVERPAVVVDVDEGAGRQDRQSTRLKSSN